MSECKVVSTVLIHTVTPYLSKPRGLGSIPAISHFFTLFYKALSWHWLFLGLFEKVQWDIMLLYFKNVRCVLMRNGLSKIILHKTYSVLTYDNSQVSLAKLMSLLFLSTHNCLYVLIEFYSYKWTFFNCWWY